MPTLIGEERRPRARKARTFLLEEKGKSFWSAIGGKKKGSVYGKGYHPSPKKSKG